MQGEAVFESLAVEREHGETLRMDAWKAEIHPSL
jgi:hypothetical protein